MDKLTPRKIKLDTTNIPQFWAAGLIYPTHFLNAISLSFPAVEKMVVITMKAVLKDIDDPNLVAGIKDFCLQENNHSAIHHKFNSWILGGSAPPAALQDFTAWCEDVNTRSMKERVSAMVAFEYFTGSCSRLLMPTFAKARADGRIDEESFKLWYWHCAEEIEHHEMGWELVSKFGVTKSDLNKAVREFFSIYYPYLLSAAFEMLKNDAGAHKSLKVWLQASVFLSRHARRMTPYFLSFFKADFGPDEYKALDSELMQDFLSSGIEYRVG